MRAGGGPGEPGDRPDVTAHPTPIHISKRARTALLLAVLVALAFVVWRVPLALTTTLGGITLALVLSFPVRFLSRFVPRGVALLLSLLLVVGLVVLALVFIVPLVLEQTGALANSIPSRAAEAERHLSGALDFLRGRGLVPGDPEEFASGVREDLTNAIRAVFGNVLGGAFGLVAGASSLALVLFGVVFIGLYLLADVRRIQAAYLRTVPHRYRRDARTLWDAFGYSLSRYLSGLALLVVIQGALSTAALLALGVPFVLALGVWVSVTAVIPSIGTWIGAAPALLVALTVSPIQALLVLVLFNVIWQVQGSLLMPRIQGQSLGVHPILVFLAVIVGGELAGLPGALFSVPALAILRVLLDFFRVRLRTD